MNVMANTAASTGTSPTDVGPTNCVVGIGSFHGDDRAGWEVIDRLSLLQAGRSQVVLRKAVVPHDVLDWLNPLLRLHIVDACDSDVGGVQRLEILGNTSGHGFCGQVSSEDRHTSRVQAWKLDDHQLTRSLAALRSRSTHQFDMLSTLELASALGRLPPRFILWTIAIDSAQQNAEIGQAARNRVIQCVERIEQELCEHGARICTLPHPGTN